MTCRHPHQAVAQWASVLAVLTCLTGRAPGQASKVGNPAAPRSEATSLPATRVRFDFIARPAPEILALIEERSGLPVRIGSADDRRAQARSFPLLTLTEPEPVPYWEALERVMQPSQLAILTVRGFSGPNELTLVPLRGVRGPVHIDGAFRCEVLSVNHQRSLAFGLTTPPNVPGRSVPTRRGDVGPAAGPTRESLEVRVQIRPEPRRGLRVVPTGPPRVVEATDEQGRSLIVAPSELQGLGPLVMTGGIGAWVAELPLAMPGQPSSRLKRLVGTASFEIQFPHPDSLDIPLTGSVGKSFNYPGATITILRFGTEGRGLAARTRLELQHRPDVRAALDPSANLDGIEFVDPAETTVFGGRTVQPDPAGGQRLMFEFPPGQVPARLHAFAMVKSAVVVRFEFADLLLP